MSTKPIDRTPAAYDSPLLIKQLINTPLVQCPDQEIIYQDIRRQTYRELRERIGRLASSLTGLGIGPGDTVAVMDWDSHRYLECFFAIPMMGAVLHTINVRLPVEQILYTINHAQDAVILVNTDFLPLLEQIHQRIEPTKKLVVMSDTGKPPATILEIATEYEALLETGDPDFDFPDLPEDTQATTFYTTGTTGQPKGVYYSHRQLVMHTLGVNAALGGRAQGGIGRDDVYMPITPMFHVHGWGVPYLATLLGLKQVYPGRYEPELLLELMRREQVTFSHCVPSILHGLLACPRVRETDLSRWKVVIGGSALPGALARQALERGVDVFGGYGLSETGPALTLAQLKPHMLNWDEERQLDVRCTAGLPMPLVELKIVDFEMNEVPHDGESQGEIVVRAPWLTQGYLHDPEGSEALWQGGYLHTGDVGTLDAKGYLKITDRIKDIIKTGGEWVSSLALEDLILQHSAVSEAAVIGVADPKWGERPLALVVLKSDQADQVQEADIKAFLEDRAHRGMISDWAIPQQIIFIEAIPKTSVGKTDKKLLRKQYAC